MSAVLITGLVVSSVPVLAFAEQGKEEIVAGASELQEKDMQADSDTNKENDSETEIKTNLISEEEDKKSGTENPEETEQLELEILPEEIPEELLTEIELATSSNALREKEENIDEQLHGTWAADEYTSLKFDEDGQGSMLLPESEYEFRYVLKDDKLTLDFASSRAKDAEYTVSIDEDSMKLTGGEEAMVQEIILQRTE